MIRSRVFVFVALTLFLAGCLRTEAEPAADAPANINKAKKAVAELQELTAIVVGHAEAKLRLAENTNSDVKAHKNKAESAEAAVRTATGAITVKGRKDEANAVAKKATEELGEFRTLYQAAKTKADQAYNDMNGFLTRAKALVESAKIEIPADSNQEGDYAKVIQNATAVTDLTTTLSTQINASTVLSDEDPALTQLRDSAKKIEVFKYQAESIAIVSRIESVLKTAETDIQNIPQKKEEINTIVQAIKTKCEGAPDTLKSSLSSLCTTAESQLQIATTKVQESQQCNTDMQQGKKQLDATLATLVTLKDATEEEKATDEAAKVKGHEVFIDGKLQKITAALLAADNALSSAKGVQQQMQDALDKTSEQPVNTHLDKTEETKSTQLTNKRKQNQKDDNSELLNNDKLRNNTKDVTNNTLIGGQVPTRSAANDSAVTVFIPLLVILVISAVLH